MIIGNVGICERQAEGIVVCALQDRAAAADHRPYVAQMVRDVVLRCICSRTGVSRQLAVRGQDIGDGELVRCQRRSDPMRKYRLNYL